MSRVHLFASHGFKFGVDSICVKHFCVWLTFTFLMLVLFEIFYRDLCGLLRIWFIVGFIFTNYKLFISVQARWFQMDSDSDDVFELSYLSQQFKLPLKLMIVKFLKLGRVRFICFSQLESKFESLKIYFKRFLFNSFQDLLKIMSLSC